MNHLNGRNEAVDLIHSCITTESVADEAERLNKYLILSDHPHEAETDHRHGESTSGSDRQPMQAGL